MTIIFYNFTTFYIDAAYACLHSLDMTHKNLIKKYDFVFKCFLFSHLLANFMPHSSEQYLDPCLAWFTQLGPRHCFGESSSGSSTSSNSCTLWRWECSPFFWWPF